MQRSYDETVRRLTLDSKVSTYKSYLVWGFGITEAFLKSIFKLDMDGFAKQQIVQMNSYERLLVELGEKSYLEEKSQWSVEVRLLGTIVFNAAVFIGSKMLLRKTGTDFMNIASDYETSSQPPPQKKKMKGPNINISDLG